MALIGNIILTGLTLIAQIVSVLLLVVYIKERKDPNSKLIAIVGKKGITYAFVVSLAALLGSLFYSDVLGYNPCKFCWFQRILMYPQVLLLGLALKRKEIFIIPYSLVFCILGMLLSLNHYILQMTGTSIIPCSAVGQSVACNKIFVVHLGYITIPLMAFTAFSFMTLLLLFARQYAKNNSRR